MSARILVLLAFGLASCLPAHANWPDQGVETLWQTFNEVSGEARSSDDPDAIESLLQQAHQALIEAEAGLRPLSLRDRERLEMILELAPARLAQAPVARGGPSGIISGTVVDAGTLDPIAGTQLRLQSLAVLNQSYFVSTQPDGTWSITAPPGTYVLQVGGSATHLKKAWPDIPCLDGKSCSVWYAGDPIEIADGDNLTGYDFELERGVQVSGTVLDPLGDPVQGAAIYVRSRSRSITSFVSTDVNGEYSISSAVPPGDYRLFVRPPPARPELLGQLHDGQNCLAFNCQSVLVLYRNLSSIGVPEVADFQLVEGFGLSGQVTEADGLTPLPGAQVNLLSIDGYTSVTAASDGSGNYSFAALPSGDYSIRITHPQRLWQVHPGLTCFGTDCAPEIGTPVSLGGAPVALDFSLEAGATVTGQVVRQSNGAPLEGVPVNIFNQGRGGRFAFTDASGNFSISGLAEGTFYAQARPDPGVAPELQRVYLGNVNCPATDCGNFGQPLSVPASGLVTDIDFSLPLGGGLSGVVTDAATGLPMHQGFVARLELWVASGPYTGRLAFQALSDFNGEYVANGLMPGAYKAVFGTSTHLGLIDTAFGGQACARGSCDQSALPTVFVTAGAVLPGISASLPRGPKISGRIVDAVSGQPAPAPRPGDLNSSQIVAFYGTSGNYASFDFIDGEGFYESRTGFPNDTFFVSTFSTRNQTVFGGGYVDQAYDGLDCPRLQCNLTAAATALTVAGASITDIDFAMRQGGGISGVVSDADGGAPLGGVTIEAYNSSGNLVANAISNAIGGYELEGLPGGDYSIRTRNGQGYQDQLHAGISCSPFCDPTTGTSVSVADGSVSSGIDFDLVQSVAMAGTVSLSSAPIANITVEVYGAIGNFLGSTLTNAAGEFSFTDLAPGEFYLRTRNAFGHADVLFDGQPCVGNACQVRRGDAIVLTAGSSVTGLNLDLSPGAVISGEVHDRTAPASKLSGVRVQLLDVRGAVAHETLTDSDGLYSFSALAAGNYHLVTRQSAGFVDQAFGGAPCPDTCNGLNGVAISVAAGASSGGNTLDLAPGASISGNVSAGGSPAVGALAQVYNASGVPVFQRPTNPSGNYEINELPDGDFYVRVTNVPGFVSELYQGIPCSGYCDILNGDAVQIASSVSVGSVNFSLAAGGSISGTVTRDGGGALPAITVLAYDNAGFIAGGAVTNAIGQYTINGLVNGDYRLRTTNAGGFVDRVYAGASCSPSPCLLSSGSVVSVAGVNVSAIDFTLAAGNSIAGTATDAFGNPLPTGTAVLLDADGIELFSNGISSGLWAFDGLANGTYYLLIENDLGLIDELYDGVLCPAGACDITGLGTPIELPAPAVMGRGAGGAASFNVVLSKGSSIIGTVVDAQSGDPLADITVFVYGSNGQLAGYGITDGLGEYETAGGLPAGDYYVATASGLSRGAGGNYINQLHDGGHCLLACDFASGQLVSVAENGTAGPINFELEQGAGVRGRVLGPDGENLVQAEVLVFDANGILAGLMRTDSQGRYQIDGLPGGTYYGHTRNNLNLEDVVFGDAGCGDACEPLSGQSFTVPSTGQVEEINFQLRLIDTVFADRFQ